MTTPALPPGLQRSLTAPPVPKAAVPPPLPGSSVEQALLRVRAVRDALRRRFIGRDEAIDAIIYGAVADQPILFVGPPGTAKSKLITCFCELLGIHSGEAPAAQGTIFQYLLSEFTVPEELFGYPDLRRFEAEGVYARQDQEMIQNATVVFLDEVFNASSALLNAMLALLNERCFYDRGRRRPARYRIFLGATQLPPSESELLALYDRFTLRIATDRVGDEQQRELLRLGLGHRLQPVAPLAAISDFDILGRAVQERVHKLHAQLSQESSAHGSDDGVVRFLRLVRHLRSIGVPISDRKIVNLCTVLLARSVVEAADPFALEGLWLLRFALHDPADAAILSLLERAVQSCGASGSGP